MKSLAVAFTFGMWFTLSISSLRADVVFVGNLQDNPNGFEVGRWSRASTPKTFDIDGNDLYGSDGYAWMNTNNTGGFAESVFAGLLESAPTYTTGGIAYTGVGAGYSGSFNGAENALNPTDTGIINVGYAGVDYGSNDASVSTLQEVFSYTMNRDMEIGEVIRVGVVLDSLGDTQIGADALRLVAGGDQDDATLVANLHNSTMDMYFFDVTGLTIGDDIEIWLAKNTTGGINAATLGAVTFDSVVNPVPEPTTVALWSLLGISLVTFRRYRRK